MVARMSIMETPLLRPKPQPKTALGRWLRRNGYTGAELARALDVDKGAISRIVNYGGPMSPEMEAKIKKATGLKSVV